MTLDTGNFLVEQFRRFPGRVFIAPGNHDPYKPDALYRHIDWPTNVHIFQSMAWQAVEFEGITLWGLDTRAQRFGTTCYASSESIPTLVP